MRFKPRPPQSYDAMGKVKSDIEIARAAKIKPIGDVLGKFYSDPFLLVYRPSAIAKLNFEYIDKLKDKKSNLILVTAITPTPAGKERQQPLLV